MEIERKIIIRLSDILIQNDISLIYKVPRFKIVKRKNYQKFCLVCFEENSYKNFVSRMYSLSYEYINIFLSMWNIPIDYSNIINSIINDIPCFCKYFINLLSSKEQVKKIINFFLMILYI